MIKINLVPKEILDKELQKQRAVQAGAAAGLVVLIFAGISFKHYYKGVTLEKHLTESQDQLKRLEAIVKQVEALEAQVSAVRSRMNVMKDLDRARPLYPVFMTELLRTFPSGLWLTNLATTASGQELTVNMSATAQSPEVASRWLETLQTSELFSDPQMGGLSIADTGQITFTMGVKYKAPAPAEQS